LIPWDYANDNIKEVTCVPPHHPTQGREREEAANPASNPTSKSGLILSAPIFTRS